ncbi:CATRA system-associated protein [Streptomyces sp. NPDC005573]|uniref:CATRA system-associated protein n=1 Tax=Streptomyces sp. NPDC005573 TaxID=3156890 RepID=UPI0033AE10FC
MPESDGTAGTAERRLLRRIRRLLAGIDATARPVREVSWRRIDASLSALEAALGEGNPVAAEAALAQLDDLIVVPVRGTEPPDSGEPPPPEVTERVSRLLDRIGRLLDAFRA